MKNDTVVALLASGKSATADNEQRALSDQRQAVSKDAQCATQPNELVIAPNPKASLL